MRNPNGYGSVVKLSGNRRKPFVVRKTIGWSEEGYPIYEIIGYTATREEGNILLAEYNKAPWDINEGKLTLQELYDYWLDKKSAKLGKSLLATLKAAYKHCSHLADVRYIDIKAVHMQDCIDNCGKGYSTQAQIKNLWGHLDNFALEIDLSSKGYSKLLKAEPAPETSRTRFTDEEIKKVWEAYYNGVEWADTMLMFLYTGFRISELLEMKTENVNLIDGTFKGGTKTTAGKNRIVPIHSKIMPLVQDRYNESNQFLISLNGKNVSDYKYRREWKSVTKLLGIKKTPHECRHTFESVLDSNGANRRCIDLLMGHVSKDTGNRIYNHKTTSELKKAIELFIVN